MGGEEVDPEVAFMLEDDFEEHEFVGVLDKREDVFVENDKGEIEDDFVGMLMDGEDDEEDEPMGQSTSLSYTMQQFLGEEHSSSIMKKKLGGIPENEAGFDSDDDYAPEETKTKFTAYSMS